MQTFDRGAVPPPAVLRGKRALEARRVLLGVFGDRRERAVQTRFDMAPYTLDTSELIEAAAKLFRYRCAFCERTTSLGLHRFRPIGEAGPSEAAPATSARRSHLYYVWLANAWENIYPICAECRPAEPSLFPVRGKRCGLPGMMRLKSYGANSQGLWGVPIPEKIVLIDPCQPPNSIYDNLAALPDGQLLGIKERGLLTVRHFNLDRQALVDARREAFARYLDDLATLGPSTDSGLFDFPSLEHGGGWYLLLRQIALKLSDPEDRQPVLSPQRIAAFYRSHLARPGFLGLLREAVEDLQRDPTQVQLRRQRILGADEVTRPVAFDIRNFKSIPHLKLALAERASPSDGRPKAPALMILGENAAGKTSILEAIALALVNKRQRDSLDLPAPDLRLDPRLFGVEDAERRPAEITVTFDNAAVRSLVADGTGFLPKSPGPDGEVPVFAYGAYRLYLTEDSGKRRGSKAIRSLFYPDYALPNPEGWLASLEGPAFDEVARALRAVLALDQDFDVIRCDPETGTCDLVLPAATGVDNGVRMPIALASSGYRSVLAMICDVMRGLMDRHGRMKATLANAHAIVLIDEIEAHLHPRWKMRIIDGLRRALPNVTFIATTHDPLCLRGLANSEVMVLRRRPPAPGEDTELPFVVEPLDDLPAIDQLTVEQLLTSDFFELLSTDAAETELDLAKAADLLAGDRSLAGPGAGDADRRALRDRLRVAIRDQVRRAMPIGSTEVERLIQGAVADYLAKRRETPSRDLASLREDTRQSIVRALESL